MREDAADFTLLSRRRFLALAGAAAAVAAAPGLVRGAGDAGARGRERRGPGSLTLSASQRAAITHVKVHPGVGVMRVGNSADAFYFGPEVPGAIPPHGTTIRDAGGAIARQAARFR